MRKNYPTSLTKQQGIAFWHIMLLVGIAVTLAVCAKKGTVPYLQKEVNGVSMDMPDLDMPSLPSFPKPSGNTVNNTQNYSQSTKYYHVSDTTTPQIPRENVESLMVTANHTTRVSPPPKDSIYELQYPRELASGYYTVQVFSGYNSKNAYDLRKALRRDGYRAYIYPQETNKGILFKVRIGRYTNRSNAFAMQSKIRHTYPRRLGNSFVLLRQ